ncbi:MAG: lpxK [Rickettsiaceae bacterium]|jgi:tetraacyldisaccharide 4'-kinase|nr:lpxK [Rickettsiaceae bacterium]
MLKLNYPNFWQFKTSFLSFLLLPFSWLYYIISLIKSAITTPIRLPIPVICVGNINIGGTGKTQMALYLARKFKERGKNICIVTKGYGRQSNDTKLIDIIKDKVLQTGDEAFMLARFFPVIIYKDINLVIKIIQEQNFEIAIFDDALQNNIIKDFTIVTVDGLRGFGNERLIPAGPLRENICTIDKKANCAIVIGPDNYKVVNKINIPIFTAKITSTKVLDKIKSYIAFAGIGNPDKFYLSLKELGLNIVEKHNFPDHYNYAEDDIIKLWAQATKLNCTLVTTEKDWVKLNSDWQKKIIYIEVKLEIENENKLKGLLDETIFEKSKILS